MNTETGKIVELSETEYKDAESLDVNRKQGNP
jgi:hypothetical protein